MGIFLLTVSAVSHPGSATLSSFQISYRVEKLIQNIFVKKMNKFGSCSDSNDNNDQYCVSKRASSALFLNAFSVSFFSDLTFTLFHTFTSFVTFSLSFSGEEMLNSGIFSRIKSINHLFSVENLNRIVKYK